MSNEEKDFDTYYRERLLLMDSFIVAFRKAEENGVAPEWLNSFFEDYGKITDTGFREAIAFANKEWDLG